MKKLLVVAVASLAAISSAPAFADPCGAVMCMSTNKFSPQECKGHVDEYFEIRVYHGKKHIFDPPATAAKRYNEVLSQCEEARPEDREYVNAMYGPLEHSPFEYY
jgi:hypothetical protein